MCRCAWRHDGGDTNHPESAARTTTPDPGTEYFVGYMHYIVGPFELPNHALLCWPGVLPIWRLVRLYFAFALLCQSPIVLRDVVPARSYVQRLGASQRCHPRRGRDGRDEVAEQGSREGKPPRGIEPEKTRFSHWSALSKYPQKWPSSQWEAPRPPPTPSAASVRGCHPKHPCSHPAGRHPRQGASAAEWSQRVGGGLAGPLTEPRTGGPGEPFPAGHFQCGGGRRPPLGRHTS